MKKLIALIMALAMLFTLAACGPKEPAESSEETIIISSTENVTSDTSSTSSKADTGSTPSKTNNSSSKATPSTQQPTACTHKNVTVTPAVAASCSAEGKTEGKVCKDCGKVIVASQSIPKDDHIFNPATPEKPATCALCGTTKGDKARPDVKVFFATKSLELSNGAKITDAWDMQVVWVSDNQHNIKYVVEITNGSTPGKVSWTLDIAGGEFKTHTATVTGTTSRELAANETFTAECETGVIPATAGNYGYTLTLKK